MAPMKIEPFGSDGTLSYLAKGASKPLFKGISL